MWSFTLQIDWKQRFFVPTDEESGVELISALLTRYPILVADEEAQAEATEPEITTEMRPTQVVDLDQWIVVVTEPPSGNGHEALGDPVHTLAIEPPAKSDFALTPPSAIFISDAQPDRDASEMQLVFDF